MQCTASNERIKIANIFLSKIRECEDKPDEIIDYYTEYCLILCHSIIEYVVYDFLSSITPKISMENKSFIGKHKKKIIDGKQSLHNHEKNDEILKFLKKHKKKYYKLKKDDTLVRYFLTVRDLIVHGEFPNIYTTNINQGKTVRRFQHNLVSYLSLNNGGHLLLNDKGDKLIIGDNGPIDKLDHLQKLDDTEKKELVKMLKTQTPYDLLNKYINKITEFVKKFEKHI